MESVKLNNELLSSLFAKAEASERKRMNYDMRTSSEDNSQRMLNALLPGTDVAIHYHPQSSENVICFCGKMDEILFEEKTEHVSTPEGFEQGMDAQDIICKKVLREVERIHLDPSTGNYGCIVPAGVWHTVEVFEPCVIYEAKDGKYGEDGSETYNGTVIHSSEIPKSVYKITAL